MEAATLIATQLGSCLDATLSAGTLVPLRRAKNLRRSRAACPQITLRGRKGRLESRAGNETNLYVVVPWLYAMVVAWLTEPWLPRRGLRWRSATCWLLRMLPRIGEW